MKHLKRSLSLVLVLVMAIGMFGISANAAVDFPDADEITYTEAVDVLVGLGVFEGLENGKLNPTGDITREQAAKLIAYALLGKTAADALKVSADPFADVAANRWSAGYIAYCVNEGIINGKGDNKFDPTGKLTGIQFAKMLLCAVGYGVNDEFVGKNWDIEVSKFALSHGIFAGNLDANQAASISREVAALYLFNALTKVPAVKYSEIFGDYYTGSSVMNAVTGKVDPANPVDKDGVSLPYAYTLGYTEFNLIMVESKKEDAYTRPFYYWTQYGKQISDDYVSNTADFTYTGSVSAATLYSDLGKTLFNATLAKGNYTLVIDGVTKENPGPLDRSNVFSALGGTGAQVEVYIDANDDVKVVVVNTFLGKVTRVDAKNETTEVEVYWPMASGMTVVKKTIDVELSSIAYDKGDYVLIKMACDNTDGKTPDKDSWTVTADSIANSFEGTVSSQNDYSTKVGSTTYMHAAGYILKPVERYLEYNTVYTFYLDEMNNLIGVEGEGENAAALNYLYVTDAVGNDFSPIYGSAYVRAAVTFANGTTDVIDLYVNNANKTGATFTLNGTKKPVAQAKSLLEGKFFSYSVSGDYYTLKNVAESNVIEGNELEITGTATITFSGEEQLATSGTKLVLMDSGKTYTGYKNFPTSAKLNLTNKAKVFYVLNRANRVDTIYIVGGTDVKDSVTFAYYSHFLQGDTSGYTHMLYVDGKLESFLFNDRYPGGIGAFGYFIGSIETGHDGVSEFIPFKNDEDAPTDGYTVYTDKKYSVTFADAGYFEIDNGTDTPDFYYFGNDTIDCAIYDITNGGVKVDSLSADDEIVFVTLEEDDDVAVVIYIVG